MRWDKKSVVWTTVLVVLILAVNIVTAAVLIRGRQARRIEGSMEFSDPDRITVEKGTRQKTLEKGAKDYELLLALFKSRAKTDVTLLENKDMERDTDALTVRFSYHGRRKARIALTREIASVGTDEILFPLTGGQSEVVLIGKNGYSGLPADALLIKTAKDLLS